MPYEWIGTFYHEAMLKGWVGDGALEAEPLRPGTSKRFTFTKGDLKLTDQWGDFIQNGVTPSTVSAGTTIIWEYGIPIWVMHYSGHYETRALPFLKSVLRKTYQGKVFWGGRGATELAQGNFVYRNRLSSTSMSLVDFSGREEIKDFNSSASLGFHSYWGKLLIPKNATL